MLYLEAVIDPKAKTDEDEAVVHARYPKAKLTICGSDLDKVLSSGAAGERVNCQPCKTAKTEAIRTGQWTDAQMEPTANKKRKK